MRRWVRVAIGAGAVAVLVSAFFVVRRRREENAQWEAERARSAAGATALLPVTEADPTWGSPMAPVTIIVFGDLQSPFVAATWPVLAQVKTQYGPTKVRVVWKNRPALFHPEARAAALAAHEVFLARGNDAFWSFVDNALRGQSELGPAAYLRWASEVGVDAAALQAAAATERPRVKLEKDHEVLHKLLDAAEDPPTIYVNGLPPVYLEVDRFVPTRLSDWRNVIDEQLRFAETVTPREGVYPSMEEANTERETKRQRQGGMRASHSPKPLPVPIDDSPVRGRADAIVTIVELSDFTSPESKRLTQQIAALQAKHGDKLRVVWKNRPLPFDPRAEPAAELALEAGRQKGNDGFWRAHDELFAASSLERADLERIAKKLALDLDAVRAALDERKHKARIEADQALAAKVERGSWSDETHYPRYGSVDGGLTPLVAVNGLPIEGGNLNGPDVSFAVEDALTKFEKEHGAVASADWYAHLLKEATPPSAPSPVKTTPAMWSNGIQLAGDRSSHGADPIPRREIEAAIDQERGRIRRCQEDALQANPRFGGRVMVEVAIDGTGKVRLVQDGGSSVPDAQAARCVREILRGIAFPPVPVSLLAFVAVFSFDHAP